MATKLLLPAKTDELSPLQKGWLLMAQNRMELFTKLEKDELAIQALLKDVDKKAFVKDNDTPETMEKALTEVQKTLKEAKALYEESKDARLFFTNMINEKLIEPAMAFEKRNKELIDKTAWKEVEFRRDIVKKNDAFKQLQNQRIMFKAHCENEWGRKAAVYRADLKQLIADSYTTALKQKQPEKQIPAYIKSIEKMLHDVKLVKFEEMKDNPLSKEECKKIYEATKKYDGKEDLDAAISELHETFKTYKQDLKNSTKAIAAIKEETAEALQQIETDAELDAAQNTLLAKSGTATFSAGPSMKYRMEVVEENSWEWAIDVINAFFKNKNEAQKHLRVKTWSKLSIGQMAESLAKIATADNSATFKGLTLKKIEK